MSIHTTRGRPPLHPGQTGNYTRHKNVTYGRPLHKDNVPASDHPSLYDIVWVAGIYEGEGCITSPSEYSLTIAINQKDPWILKKIHRLFGGLLAERDHGRYWGWTCTGDRARGFALTIYKFLSPRRKSEIFASLVITNPRLRAKYLNAVRQGPQTE